MVIERKTVLVTGASSGIGKNVAIESVKNGLNVILVARNLDKLNEVKSICEKIRANSTEIYILDVKNTSETDEVTNLIFKKYNGVDYLFNAAGFGDFSNDFVDSDFENVEEMFNVNVLGLMYLTRIIAKKMIEQGYGHVLNVGSMAGKIPTAKAAAYSATKAAVIAFSDSLRLELLPFNVNVTTINPGPVNTNFFSRADPSGNYFEALNKLSIRDFIFLEPDKLAKEIVNIFGSKKRELNRPRIMATASVLYKLVPNVGDYFNNRFGNLK